MRSQRTINKIVFIEGFGLHTGMFCRVVLRPAPQDNGIIFHRVDKNETIRSHIGAVTETSFAVTIGTNNAKIRTIEHLLSALAALGIDNIIIEVEGPEIPILDGSAAGFVDIIYEAGIKEQDRRMPYIKILKPVILENGESSIMAFPYDGRKISFRMHFKNHFLGEQTFSIDIDKESFVRDIAPARTFGFLRDVEYLRGLGLAKGGSLENAVVFSDTEVLNKSGLRFQDECVRHKILDSIGDFSLIGFPIYGHIIAEKSGHTTNINFLIELLTNTDSWEVMTDDPKPTKPIFSYSYI